ncbi:AAA family ATPase [Roseivirga pacifica]|uniref:AAA family ATPase n=1 Tax=Roseivirga pacifica TaxID=1267423 RepID=UPI003BAEEFF7
MIVGTLLRNIKTYVGINYIPLSNGHSYCGLVGNNGIGKSSVLEALDCLFNQKPWNYNIVVRKSGITTTRPHIVPIFLIQKNLVSSENQELAKLLSDYVWECSESDFLAQNKVHFNSFKSQREILERDNFKDDYYLLPLGRTHDGYPSLSIFNNRSLGEILIESFEKSNQTIKDEELKVLDPLIQELSDHFDYIYIPKDIDPENFTQLETKEIQGLMGETLNDIVAKCVPQTKIQEINTKLNEFIDGLSATLGDYSFRTGGERQVNLRKHDVYKLIIEAYFNIRKLHKKEGDHWLDLNSLSSGEKQKAIMELAYQFLKEYRNKTDNLIVAIDEPESSLHMSACYDQFNRLAEMSEMCDQLLFTTHWYGFIPTVADGCVSVITKSKDSNEHQFDLIRISSYREQIKQSIKSSKGQLPYDIRLKSINDFTQSIITSILTDEPFNWLICEGSSEKIYFEKYFEEIKHDKKLRIIPVGGASEIKRIYNNLQVAYEDFKKEVQGKVIMVSDTDAEIVQYPVKADLKNLLCYRIVNIDSTKKTNLVRVDSNPVSPKTEIEDALNGKLFFETLKEFEESHSEIETIIAGIEEPAEVASFYALDLSPSKQKLLEKFFDTGNVKFEFALKYSEKVGDDYQTPEWIEEIKKIY